MSTSEKIQTLGNVLILLHQVTAGEIGTTRPLCDEALEAVRRLQDHIAEQSRDAHAKARKAEPIA